MNTAATKSTLLSRVEGLQHIPTIPAVLAPLLRYLEQPVEQLDVQKVTDMIAQDKSLAAQCLQMANSPLFGHWKKIDSLRGAVVGLGFHRLSDIAMSCGVLNLMPKDATGVGIDPVVFWEHSLGCALVSRHFARQISYPDPSKAYLAGLLHDLGIIVNLWVMPKEFRGAYEFARAQGIPLHEANDPYSDLLTVRAAACSPINGSSPPTSAKLFRNTTACNQPTSTPDWSRWSKSAICCAGSAD